MLRIIAVLAVSAVAVPLTGVVLPTPATAQASAAVQPPVAFAQCKACHSVDAAGRSGVGPNLHGVGGTVAGTKPGYVYSPAMKASRKRWDRAGLDAYLGDPKGVVPGTKMMVPGVSDAGKRKQIVDYLLALK